LTERIIGHWLNLRRNRNNIVLATKVAGPSAAAYFGLDPAQMAIAYVTSRPFVTSNIIGATTLGQLKTSIGAHAIVITPEIEARIDDVYQLHGSPAP